MYIPAFWVGFIIGPIAICAIILLFAYIGSNKK